MQDKEEGDNVIIIAHIGAGYFNEKHADVLKALVALSLESAENETDNSKENTGYYKNGHRKPVGGDTSSRTDTTMEAMDNSKGSLSPCLKVCADKILRTSKVLEQSELTNTGYGSSITNECSVFCDSSVCSYNMKTAKRCQSTIIMNSSRLPLKDAVEGLIDIHRARNESTRAMSQARNIAVTPPIIRVGNFKADPTLVSPKMTRLYEKYKTQLKHSQIHREDQSAPLIVNGRTAARRCKDDVDDIQAVDDTIGVSVILPDRYILTGASSGGNMFKPTGRVGCAGVVGSAVFSTGDTHCTVTVMCSGNGEDIIQLDLARSVCEYLVNNAGQLTEGPVCELVANCVYENSKKCRLLARDDLGNQILYVGLVGYIEWTEKIRKSRLVFYFHTTPTMVFGYRSRVDRRTRERCRFSKIKPNRLDARGEFYIG